MKKRIISYAQSLEDVIIYHVLKDEGEIFYIDCGANDETNLSVTKFLYEDGIGYGINIDPLPECIKTYRNRERDINICAGVGKKSGEYLTLYYDNNKSAIASFVRDRKFLKGKKKNTIKVPIKSLGDICHENMAKPHQGGVLKIDVEGLEYDVLYGADFVFFRPALLVIEAMPFDRKERFESLISDNYVPVIYYGANRFYLDKNRLDLKDRFIDPDELVKYYDILVPYKRMLTIRKMYTNSSSWKITKPFRTMKRMFGRNH